MTLKSAQLDPTNGNNWDRSQIRSDTRFGDGLWGFTVTDARSPIVFLHGSGCLSGTIKNGTSLTFLYSNATTDTRFYCFDLMSNSAQGSPYLKTYRESDGVLTFNSLQPPLNIIHSISPPPPEPPYGGYIPSTYLGGRTQSRQNMTGAPTNLSMQTDCIYDVDLGSGVTYATYLPWSRSAGIYDIRSRDFRSYGVHEGAYGRVGGISFIFGASAGTTEFIPRVGLPGDPYYTSYASVPTDRYPIALSIDATNLPFPFN